MARHLLVVAVLLFSPRVVIGQAVSLARPSLAPDGGSVLVNLGVPRPDAPAIQTPAIWIVVARSPAAPAGQQVPVASVAATQFYTTTGQVRLRFSAPLSGDVTEVDVISILGKPSRVTWKRRSTKVATLGIFPAARRDKADVFVAGSWTAGANAKPLYGLDIAAAAPVLDFTLQSLEWRFSATSTWRTASSTSLDPDSITVAARVATVFPADLDDNGPYLDLQWDMGRFEFSRKDQATNFVTAPAGVLSTAVVRKLRENRTVAAAVDVDASLALELGANLENKIVPGGYGAIVRIVPGAAVFAVFPGALGLDEIRWTTAYRLRLLARGEPLIDLREDVAQTTIKEGTRPEWSDELALKINPFAGFSIKHDYGSTPPAFKLLEHRVTVGVTVMWAWKK